MRTISSLSLLSLFSFAAVSGLTAYAEKDQEILSALSIQVGTCLAVSEYEQKKLADNQERVATWQNTDRYWAQVGERWELDAEQVTAERTGFTDAISDMESKSPGLGAVAVSAMESTLCCLPESLAEAEPGACPIARGVSKTLGGERG